MYSVLSRRSRFASNIIAEESKLAERLSMKGKKIVSLNTGDPVRYFKTPKHIINAYIGALRENKTWYSRGEGTAELERAVSKRYRRMYGIDVDESSVIITNGVSEALYYINSALINEREGAVLFRPYYPQYSAYLGMHGGIAVLGDYDESNEWNVDLDGLKKKLSARRRKSALKYMLITTPNNPTGTVLGRSSLKEAVDIANEYSMVLISDEIYDEILFRGTRFTSLGEVARGVPHIILNGASKNFDATGFRIGFVVIPETDRKSEKIKGALYDYALTRLSVNTPAQYAVAEALNNVAEHRRDLSGMVKSIESRVNLSFKILSENPYVDVVRPGAAFYLFPRLHIKELRFKNDTEFMRKLLYRECIWVREGCGFGSRNHFRIVSLATEDILEDAINRINRFCRQNVKR